MKSTDTFLDDSERRKATVLFADISGFTRMSEVLDAEELTILVNQCFKLLGAAIKNNEGTIDKYIGDCIMALFGLPLAIEDSPRKAINAALEMRRSIEEFNQSRDLKIPLGIHIGINTGDMIAGRVGSDEKHEYTVMGDSVNVASRQKDAAGSGQIFEGPGTYKHTKGLYQFSTLQPISLKGRKDPVRAYDLVSNEKQGHRLSADSGRMVHSDMIGREQELTILHDALQKLTIDQRGSIVSIIGEAGIGKSRLLAEMTTLESLKSTTSLKGRSLSYGENLSYHPVIDILKQWIQLAESDTEEVAQQKLEKAILAIDPENIDDIFPFIAKLIGLKLNDEYATRIKAIQEGALKKLILKTLREIIEKAARIRPLVLVFEDIHWADLTSIDFLQSFVRSIYNSPILFVFLFRPNYSNTSEVLRHTIRKGMPAPYTEIRLEALNEQQRNELIGNLLKDIQIPAGVSKSIIDRSGGNPFFIEEIIRSFIDDEIVTIENGKRQVTDKINSAEIPATINEVVLARIDKLENQTRSLLKVASVIGRSFFYKILIEIVHAIEQVDSRLTFLEEIQLLRKQHRLEELEYLFKHALVHEATYASILLSKRKQLHQEVATAIETIFSARIHEFFGMLALHYSRGENLDKAEEYLLKAGQEAIKISAPSEAIYNFKEALSIYTKKYGENADPEKIIMMEKNIAFAYHNKGQFPEALAYFDRILKRYDLQLPKSKVSKVVIALDGFIHILVGLYWPSLKWKKIPGTREKEIIRMRFVMLNEVGIAAPERLIPETFAFYKTLTKYDLTRIEMGVGMFSGASVVFSVSGLSFALSRKVISHVKDLVDRNEVKGTMYFEFAKILGTYLSGRFHDYAPIDKKLVNACYRIGEALYSSYYVNMHVLSNLEFGRFRIVSELLTILDEIGTKFDHHYAKVVRHFALAKLFMRYGDPEMARKVSDQDIAFLTLIDDTTHLPKSYSLRAEIQLQMGDASGAEKSLEAAGKYNLEMPVSLFTYQFYVSQLIFNVHRLQECVYSNDRSAISASVNAAQRSGKQAIRISRKVVPCQPEVFQQMGLLYWLMKRPKVALRWWGKAITSADEQGARINLALVYREVGNRLSENGGKLMLNGIDGKGYLELSKKIYQEIDSQWNFSEFKQIIESQMM